MQTATGLHQLLPDPLPTPRIARPMLREVGQATTPCSKCHGSEHCLARGLAPDARSALDSLASRRIRVRKGEKLFLAGQNFTSLFAIYSGSFKTVLAGDDGQDQVAGYHMIGDVIGADGIVTDTHDCEAVALEDSEVCRLPFVRLEELARRDAGFQRALNRLLSREIVRERYVTRILGSMQADQRLATFLLDLAARYQERGYSSIEFVLRMTREEIGSYLGLKLETVSRLLSRFQREGLIQIQGRVVKLLDPPVLRGIISNEFVHGDS